MKNENIYGILRGEINLLFPYYRKVKSTNKQLETMKNEDIIYGILNAQMDLLFDSVCEEFNLESGDISPELQERLDKCSEELLDILEKFVEENKG